ncbi:MAG: prenyltransferase/squalene oxidase repeat-containing protein [Candidatus Firestonebacteria bacterium]
MKKTSIFIIIITFFPLSLFSSQNDYLGTPASEKAADYALEWLSKNQQKDGSFGKIQLGQNPAIVGFAGLAFLAGGNVPGRGKYSENVKKIGDFLVSKQRTDGLIGQSMYEHGFAAVAMCELYGMTRKEEYKPVVQNAVNLIISCQNKKGGWRYQPRIADDDVTVTSCQVQALRAARDVGIIIPKETVEGAMKYLLSCSSANGSMSYQPGQGGGGWQRTGAGVLSLMALGDYTSSEVEKGADFVLKSRYSEIETHFYYGLYYCNQLMFQRGGEYWKVWFSRIRETLLSVQQGDGSFKSASYGPVYATALAALTLELPYGYLPLFER